MPFSDSAPGVTTLHLKGVWIHDPDDAQGTIKWFPYGNAGGGLGITIDQTANHYAGRRYPVVDYGEHQDDVMTVGVEIVRNDPYFPSGGTLLDLVRFAQVRQSLMVRDSAGRLVTGSLEGFSEQQSGKGTQQVSFTVRQIDETSDLVEV